MTLMAVLFWQIYSSHWSPVGRVKGVRQCSQPRVINWWDWNESKERLGREKPIYAHEEYWLCSPLWWPLSLPISMQSVHKFTSLPAPSGRNSRGRSPGNDRCHNNYVTEGRREQSLSIRCPRSWGKKQLLICKWLRPGERFWKFTILPHTSFYYN